MDRIIGGKYKLGRKSGNGSFGEIYLGIQIEIELLILSSIGGCPADKCFIMKEQNDLQKVTQEVEHHEDNLKFLESHVNTINESVHHLQGEPKERHSSVVVLELNGKITFVNTEKQTFDHIRQLDERAAGVVCLVKDQHGSMASMLLSTKDIVGIVTSLGKVKDEELNRTLSDYLGLETMLAIVCKTLEGVQALERYEKDGSIYRNTGLHGIASTIGRTMKGSCFCYDVFKVLHPCCYQSLLGSITFGYKVGHFHQSVETLWSAIPWTNLHGAAPNFELLRTFNSGLHDDTFGLCQSALSILQIA